MGRVLAGIAAFLLLVTGATLMWRGDAQAPTTPRAPSQRFAAALAANGAIPQTLSPIGSAPSADPMSKEEKRFARADKNQDGRVSLAELVEPRRKAFARLDLNQDGKLGFEEWSVKTIDKFHSADADKNAALTPPNMPPPRPSRRRTSRRVVAGDGETKSPSRLREGLGDGLFARGRARD